ncbi:hypothetical protein E4T44_11040 [Aureobasidium sp. EXF-8845]|nr:hypothetical protein E4T45_11399 [Aureobasidium sp. EXF-8846]KAI4808932.1 hypothetical protein E4T44_11040 [Aureobasidium sp. EXF-8845]
MRLPDHTLADDSFFALPKNNHEGTPSIELHPAQHNILPTAAATTPASSSSDKWSSSEASSFAHVIQRERISQKNFRKTMIAPRHLSLAPTSRPAPPRTIVSSPANVMQSAPPSTGFQHPVKSMTFSDALSTPRTASLNRQVAVHPHISFANSRLKTRRAKASVAPKHSISTSLHRTSINSPSRGHNRSLAPQDTRPHIVTHSKSSDSILTLGTPEISDHPGIPVSFVGITGLAVETINQGRGEAAPPPPLEDIPKQGFLRILTVQLKERPPSCCSLRVHTDVNQNSHRSSQGHPHLEGIVSVFSNITHSGEEEARKYLFKLRARVNALLQSAETRTSELMDGNTPIGQWLD